MSTATNYQPKEAKYFFGTRKSDNVKIYIDMPKWQCGWYWSFGHLGNSREHYHLDSCQNIERLLTDDKGKLHLFTERRNKHMHDCLSEDYELTEKLKNKLWVFCELTQTIYALKETAEVLGRGGSHCTSNPCESIIKNKLEVLRINEEVLPALFKELEKIFYE